MTIIQEVMMRIALDLLLWRLRPHGPAGARPGAHAAHRLLADRGTASRPASTASSYG